MQTPPTVGAVRVRKKSRWDDASDGDCGHRGAGGCPERGRRAACRSRRGGARDRVGCDLVLLGQWHRDRDSPGVLRLLVHEPMTPVRRALLGLLVALSVMLVVVALVDSPVVQRIAAIVLGVVSLGVLVLVVRSAAARR